MKTVDSGIGLKTLKVFDVGPIAHTESVLVNGDFQVQTDTPKEEKHV